MSGALGNLSRDLFGSSLTINGKNIINIQNDFKIDNALIRKNLNAKHTNSDTLTSNTITSDTLTSNTFTSNTITSDSSTSNTITSNTITSDSITTNELIINGTNINDTFDKSYTMIKIFEGTTVTVGDQVEHILYNQTNHARSIVELKIFIHDTNSNTFWRYSEGTYLWYREWTLTAQELVIGTPINVGSGDPLDYMIERLQIDNDIIVRITQNTPIDTNTKYKIIAKIIQL